MLSKRSEYRYDPDKQIYMQVSIPRMWLVEKLPNGGRIGTYENARTGAIEICVIGEDGQPVRANR
jgi:hypothetical protein